METIVGNIYGGKNPKEKWFGIEKDNNIKVFNSLSDYAYWKYNIATEEEDNNIIKMLTTLNDKDMVKIKEMNLLNESKCRYKLEYIR